MAKLIFIWMFFINPFLSASTPNDWQKWVETKKSDFQKPLAVPSILQHLYLEKVGDQAFLDEGARPRLVTSPCSTCQYLVKRDGRESVVLLKKGDATVLRKIAPGKDFSLPHAPHLHISMQDPRDGRLRLFLHDLSQKDLKEKRERDFFPYQQSGVEQARFVWLKKPRDIVMGRSDGSQKPMQIHAELILPPIPGGEERRLSVYDYGMSRQEVMLMPMFMVIFRDLTNGDSTYGAGRFLDLAPGKLLGKLKDGDLVTVDFNFSYSPPCAKSSGFHCPLPQDLINQKLEFGEKYKNKKKAARG